MPPWWLILACRNLRTFVQERMEKIPVWRKNLHFQWVIWQGGGGTSLLFSCGDECSLNFALYSEILLILRMLKEWSLWTVVRQCVQLWEKESLKGTPEYPLLKKKYTHTHTHTHIVFFFTFFGYIYFSQLMFSQAPVSEPKLFQFQFSRSVVSDSLRPHELQHTRPPCPSPSPGVHSNSRPSSQWCHPAISSSVVPFSSCPKSLPASGSFLVSQLVAWGGQSTGVSALASVLPKKSQSWSPSEWTGWISLQSKGLSRVFSNTTVQKHQFFGV